MEVAPPDRVVEIAVAAVLTCARTANGAVYCWGEDRFDPQNKEVCRSTGNDTDYRCHRTPTRVGIDRATHIAAGSEHVCAVLAKTGEVECWGYNMMSTLGDGTSEMHVQPSRVRGLRDVTELSLGAAHSCALVRNGGVWCWGANNMHAVGDGTGVERAEPVRVHIDGALHIAAGAYHSCALLRSGSVACWGDNGLSQLGDGTSFARPTPTAVAGLSNIVEIVAGHQNTCARTDDGHVWCWGVGYVSDPRHELSEDRTGRPRKIPDLGRVTQLTLGTAHACAVVDRGVTCWGYHHEMARVDGLVDIDQVESNWNNTCVLHSTGAIDCWGSNQRGQLGDGTTEDRVVPTRVALTLPR